jgi:hypothetical protein
VSSVWAFMIGFLSSFIYFLLLLFLTREKGKKRREMRREGDEIRSIFSSHGITYQIQIKN